MDTEPQDGADSAPGPAPTRAGSVDRAVALPISTVAARLDLSQATLRMWQNRYGLGPIRTTPGGHRRYSPEDVDRLQAVKRLIARGVSTGDAAHAVLAAARHDIPLPAHADPLAHRVCAAALDLDGPTARWLLREHLAHSGVADTWEKVVRPVLATIGDRWDRLSHGIAVEHLLSHIATTVLGEALPHRRPPTDSTPVLLACAPDEMHELPMVALAATLAHHGIAATVLGARTLVDPLAEAVDRRRPTVVVIHAQLAELARATIFDELPPTAALIAAGPGWDPAQLPAGIPHVNDLATATATVVARDRRNQR